MKYKYLTSQTFIQYLLQYWTYKYLTLQNYFAMLNIYMRGNQQDLIKKNYRSYMEDNGICRVMGIY